MFFKKKELSRVSKEDIAKGLDIADLLSLHLDMPYSVNSDNNFGQTLNQTWTFKCKHTGWTLIRETNTCFLNNESRDKFIYDLFCSVRDEFGSLSSLDNSLRKLEIVKGEGK